MKRLQAISKTGVNPDLPRILFSGMFLWDVQNALSGFPLTTSGNDSWSFKSVFEMAFIGLLR
ncbi:MAG: hypothetical protein Q8P51_11020 [Ignavibacteria bacterium]|nr:hypothetical protein [Ignavibacteria bacterium]